MEPSAPPNPPPPGSPERRTGWVLPEERPPRPPVPRPILVAGILLVALGILVAMVGPLLLAVATALEVDPELAVLAGAAEAADVLSTVGSLCLFGGVLQFVAGIGVLRLRPGARVLGIGTALVSAVAFGLGAVILAGTAGNPDDRALWQVDTPFAIVALLAVAGAYLVAAIALTQDWPPAPE